MDEPFCRRVGRYPRHQEKQQSPPGLEQARLGGLAHADTEVA